MKWRLLHTPPFDGAANMAYDVALMGRARDTGEAVLRVYSWSAPTLSLGRNQVAAGRYDAARIEAAGIDVVRRPTGGRALLHWREVTYSVTAPCGPAESLSESYARINSLLVAALRKLGVRSSVAASAGRMRSPDALPCFAEPSAGEIVVEADGTTAKLVGSAQVRDGGAMLQHGSILVDDDQAMIGELMIEAPDRSRPATLRRLLGRAPECGEVAAALFTAVTELEDSTAAPLDGAAVEHAAVEGARAFRDPLWTWRR